MAELSLNDVLKKIKKNYGENVVKVGVDDLSIDGVLSLGSPTFDFCLYGGVPEGRIIELCGAEGSGKTTTAFLIAKVEELSEENTTDEKTTDVVNQEEITSVVSEVKEDSNTVKEIDEKTYKLLHLLSLNVKVNDEEYLKALKDDLNDNTLVDLLSIVKESKLKDNPQIISLFIFYVASVKKGKKVSITYNDVIEDLDEDVVCAANFYAITLSNDDKQFKLSKTLYKRFKKSNKKNIYLPLCKVFIGKKVVDLRSNKQSNAVFKTIERTFAKNEKKLNDVQYNVFSKILMDSYGNSFNKNYGRGFNVYKKMSKNLDDEAKEYCLLRLADNHLIHEDFKQATKLYEEVLNINDQSFDAVTRLMLSTNKFKTFEELFAKKKLDSLRQFAILETMVSDNPLLQEKFDEFVLKEKEYRLKGKDKKLAPWRKGIFVLAIFSVICFFVLGVLIDFTAGKWGVLVASLCMPLSHLLTSNIKKSIKGLIIKSTIAVIIIVLGFVFI